MDLIIILGLFIHYFADFVYQTHEESINKSSSFKYLTDHTVKYSTIWSIFMIIVCMFSNYNALGSFLLGIVFGTITFVAHTTTDYFTSRWAKKYFSVQNYHNGFLVIGFDQILHYLQLYYTYKLLIL